MNTLESLKDLEYVVAVYKNYNEYVVVINKYLDNYDEVLDILLFDCDIPEDSKISVCEERFLNRGIEQMARDEFNIQEGELIYKRIE